MFTLPQDITYTNGLDADIDSLDPDGTGAGAGFQSSFSKIGASEKTVYSPVAHVADSKAYASKELARRSQASPGVLTGLVQQAQGVEGETVGRWVEYMRSQGDAIA